MSTQPAPRSAYGTVPLLWPGGTIVCLACGPSLSAPDVELVRRAREAGRVRVIAINAAVRLAPWADVRYAHHAADWDRREDQAILAAFKGLKYSIEAGSAKHGATLLRMSGSEGLETVDRGAIRHGKTSGYQSIGVAVHLGAKRIILLGYDAKRNAAGVLHFYSCVGRQGPSDFAIWLRHYATLPGPLAAAGVDVLNASRETAIEVFPRVELEEVL